MNMPTANGWWFGDGFKTYGSIMDLSYLGESPFTIHSPAVHRPPVQGHHLNPDNPRLLRGLGCSKLGQIEFEQIPTYYIGFQQALYYRIPKALDITWLGALWGTKNLETPMCEVRPVFPRSLWALNSWFRYVQRHGTIACTSREDGRTPWGIHVDFGFSLHGMAGRWKRGPGDLRCQSNTI